MTGTGRKATVALAAAVTMFAAGRASANGEPAAAPPGHEAIIVLHVINHAALRRDVLDAAKARVEGVYDAIGVHAVWVDSQEAVNQRQDGRPNLTVLLLSRDMAEKKISAERIKDGVLGQAHPVSGRAHIFCDRIATTPGPPRYLGRPLGDVIAHEVGHLLLGTNSHSGSGIMRANMNVQAIHLVTFDKTQALTIRTSLQKEASTLVRNEAGADLKR